MSDYAIGGAPVASDGLGANDPPATPYRGTVLHLDVPEWVMVEPPFGLSKSAEEMCRHPEAVAASSNVHRLDQDGWENRPLQQNPGFSHERQEVASSIVTFNIPSGFTQSVNSFRKPSDQPGALTGADSNISNTGDPFIKKRVGASRSWDDASRFQLFGGADQAALPSPDIGEVTLLLDRIALGVGNHDPNQGFFLRSRLAGGKQTQATAANITYFCGPAGVDAKWVGNGYYALEQQGGGILLLHERCVPVGGGSAAWVERTRERYCPSNVATIGTHHFYVRPVTYRDPKGSASGHIYIYHEGSTRTSGGGENQPYASNNSNSLLTVYTAPATGKTKPTSWINPFRIDMRRGERHEIQVSYPVYPNSGVLQCDAFAVDSYLLSTRPLKCFWWGIVPDGCSIDIRAYDALTNAELTAEGTTGLCYDASSHVIGGYRYYTVTYPQRQFYVKITLTGPGDLNGGTYSSKTPILQRYQIVKDGRADDISPTEQTTRVTEFSMIGQDSDPSHESAGATVKDIGNSFSILSYRASIPCLITTRYDKDDTSKLSHLGRVWLEKATATRKGSKIPNAVGSSDTATWADEAWKSYSLQFLGQWTRLAVGRMPFRWDFTTAADLGKGPKVTDIIRQGFSFAGIVNDQVDVPDLPTRMFVGDENPKMFLEPMADIAPFLMHLAFDYLGCWLCFDPNSSITGSGIDRGLWRLRPSNFDPDTGTVKGPILAHFHTNAATDSNKLAALAIVHSIASYPIEVSGDEFTGIQETPHCYVRKHTLDSWVRPPEANIITVTGTGVKLFGAGRDAEEQFTVTLANPKSFNFAGLDPDDPKAPDPTNPDYLPYISPYLFHDRAIRTLNGAQWIARRIYQRICHGGKCLIFEAPLLLVTDKSDTYQVRPRPLRFFDAVKVDGITFFVKNVTIKYRKDRAQMAVYELELPNGALY